MSKECVNLGRSPPERLKHVHGVAAAPQSQNRVTETPTCFEDLLRIIQTNLFKCAECISAEDFGPFIAVIPGRVSTTEDMLKGTQRSVFGE